MHVESQDPLDRCKVTSISAVARIDVDSILYGLVHFTSRIQRVSEVRVSLSSVCRPPNELRSHSSVSHPEP